MPDDADGAVVVVDVVVPNGDGAFVDMGGYEPLFVVEPKAPKGVGGFADMGGYDGAAELDPFP